MSCLENSGRRPASEYEGATMYTTLSPCDMCTGACVLYKVARVVIGENRTFLGGEAYLKERGIEVVVLGNVECEQLMQRFIKDNSNIWYVHSIQLWILAWLKLKLCRNEDIGVPTLQPSQ